MKTPKEALDALNERDFVKDNCIEELAIFQLLVDKATPIKPEILKACFQQEEPYKLLYKKGRCNCGSTVWSAHNNFCPKCGQALDWEK